MNNLNFFILPKVIFWIVWIEYNSAQVNFATFFVFFSGAIIKIKMMYLAHIVFLLDTAGLDSIRAGGLSPV